MVIFESDELEIAMVTYNRCEFVADWLNGCYEEMRKRNVHFSIYDSSTNNDTEVYIKNFKEDKNDSDIEYHHVDSDIIIGHKPLLPLFHSRSKYVWVAGDSFYWDYEMLDCKVFPYLKKDVDCAVCYVTGYDENIEKLYTDMPEFINKAFISLTCIGATICKTSIFEPLKNNGQLRKTCDSKYKGNYGFEWLGYFLEMLLLQDHTAYFALGKPAKEIKPDKKRPSWGKHYYQCWIKNLLEVLDGIAGQCQGTEIIVKDVWKWLSLDTPSVCYYARQYGDLNPETYNKYKQNGMLERCTEHPKRMERFAYVADEALDALLEQELENADRQFRDLCHLNVEKIRIESKELQLWIYGAGTGGKILAECLNESDVPICGFLDKQANCIQTCAGIPVKTLNEVDLKDAYIVISMRDFTSRCIAPLLQAGVPRKHIFYPVLDCMQQSK